MLGKSDAFSGFSVNDIPAAKEFYGDTLGLKVAEEPAGLGLQFDNGGRVFIYPKDDHQPATFTILNFPVEDIEAAVDALVERGVAIERYWDEQDERGIANPPPGGGPRITWFKDPAGNILSLLQG